MNIVHFDRISKSYGATRALREVSFDIAAGEIVALLGPNGAGKTTAIEILLGLRHADSGVAEICGSKPQTLGARTKMAATPQDTGFPDALRVGELVAFAAEHFPHPRPADDVLRAFELEDLARKGVGSLSGGQQRRVALALAFVANTPLVLLDEPTIGLDVESRRRLWDQLRDSVDATRTVLFTTHYLEEAEALATRVIVIDRGEIRFDGTPDAFRAKFGAKRVEYVGEALAGYNGAAHRVGERTIVTLQDTDAYVRELVRAGIDFRDLAIKQSSFEDIFLEITGGAS